MSRKVLAAVLVVIAFVFPLGSALADHDDDEGEHHGWGHHHGDWEEHGWGHGWGHWHHHGWGHWGGYAIYPAPVYVVPYSYGYYAPYYGNYGYSYYYHHHHHAYYAHRRVVHHYQYCRPVCCCY